MLAPLCRSLVRLLAATRPLFSLLRSGVGVAALVLATATSAHAVYVEALTNGGFESSSGDASLTTYRIYDPHNAFVEIAGSNALASTTGWRTTAPDEAIEVWKNGFNGVSTSAGTGPAAGGTYFAEINANVPATLYQDVTFKVVAQVDYFFMHRARQGTDTMRFTITDFGPDNVFGTGDDVEVVSFAVANNTINESGESNGWRPYFGNNVFNSIVNRKYRIALSAISTGSGSPSVGNFVDSISFGAELETQANFGPPSISDITNQSTNEDQTISGIAFTVSDSVTPAASLTVTAFSEDTAIVPQSGIVVTGSGTNRSIALTPVANASGTVTITVAVNDGSFSTIDTFVLTVNPVNDVPSFVKGSNISVAEDATAQTVAGWATSISAGPADEASQTLSFTVTNDNNGLFSVQPALSSTGTLTYTPAPNANGTAIVSVQLHDSGGTANGGVDTSAVQTFNLTITAVNDAPVAVADSYSTNEDTLLTVPTTGVLGNDTDVEGSALTAVLVTGVSHGALTLNANGSFTYTPAANYNGPDSFTYKANDGTANSNVVTVSLTVNAVNDAPVAVADSYSTNEDTVLTVPTTGVLGNDTDVEGNPLTAVLVTGVSHGALTLNANGSFTYTPAANYNGPDSFTYKANDGTADSNVVTVSLTVTAVNDAPVAVVDSYTTAEDTVLTVPAAGVLSNDTDVEGSALTAVLVTGVSHGALTLNANGSFTYTPAANYNGPDSYTYKANDGTANSNIVTVSLTVTAVNDTPVAVADSYSTNEDTLLTVPVAGVLSNDTDVEGSALTAVLVTGVSHGALTLNANGSFTYTPAANYNGPDSFTYKANDGTADSNVVTVSLTVTAVNDAPVAVANSYTTAEDTALTVAAPGVLGNDTDVEGSALTAVLVTDVSHGALTLNANGGFTYTPAANYSGPDSYTYQANDGTANSNIVTVSIDVTAVNDAPVAVANSFTTAEDTALTVAAPGVLGNDTDVEGSALTAVLVTDVSHGVLALNADGHFTYTPAANYNGPDSFTYQANDGTANSNVVTVSLTVTAVNDAPVAVANSFTATEDTALTVAAPGVLGNDTDVDGDTLNAVLVTGVSHGALTLNADGSFSYTPAANYSGPDSYTYKAYDGTANSNVVTVSIDVTAVNDAPAAVANSFTTAEDTALTVAAPGVLGNDTDADGDGLTAVLVTGVSHGSLTLNPNGSFIYTPAANYHGPDSYTYKANDGTASSNVVTVSIDVTTVNDAPVAVANSYTATEDTALTMAAPGVLGNDTDVDGDALTAVLVTGPTHGALTLNANGSFTYTPAANYSGPDSYTYQANDGTIDSNIATVSIDVMAVNDAPVAVANSYTATEDTALTVTAPGVLGNDTDADGDALTAVLVTGPTHGALTLNANGSFTYTPVANYNGPDSYTYKTNDGTANSNVATVSIDVTPVSDAPVAVADSFTATEDTALTVAAPGVLGNDTDADGDTLTTVLVSGPNHGSLTLNANGSFTYTPAANYNGPDSFTYRANDGTTDSNPALVSIDVNTTNDAPVAVANSYTATEDTALTVAAPGVLGNDSDVDGDTLNAVLVTGVSHGALTLNANGSFTYTPAANYHGPDSYTYKANDGTADSNVVTVAIDVTSVNDAPVAVANSYTATEDTALTVAGPGVLGNDTDVEGDTLSAVLVTGVTHGTLVLNADGGFTYTPAANYNGPDSFTYEVNDGTTNSNVVTVSIEVGSVNDVPVAVANSYTATEDTALTVAGPGVLGNDTDADGDPLSAVLVTGVSHGTLVLNANGSFTYTPAANYNGPDSFTYQANDGTVNSNVATVSIDVGSVNDVPVAVANSYTATEDTALTVAGPGVLGNDTDTEGDTLNAVLVTGVSHGTLTLNANGSFTYTPAANYNGPDAFTYKANDGTADSNVVTVSLTVTAVNDAPVAVANSYTTTEDTALNLAVPGVLGNDTDADGDPLTSILVTGVSHGTLAFNANGSFVYTPAANYNGPDSFTYKANDGTVNSNVVTVSITVDATNDAPVAVAEAYGTNEDTALTVPAPGLLGNDTDVEESTLTSILVTGVSHGTLVLNADGSFTYTPAANYTGADSFTYKANDGTADSNVVTVALSVAPVNDAPVAVADSYTTLEDTALTVPAAGVLGNDTDAESDALTAALVTSVSHGVLVLNANGSFTYTPTANYNGADSFTYKANDGTADSNVMTVSLTVTPVNDAPVAVADSYTVPQGSTLTVATGVLGNDSDLDGDPLTAQVVTGVSHGTLTLNANGSFTYQPTAAYVGPDSYTYKVNDGTADSNVVTVSLAVTAVNHPPVLTQPPALNTLGGIPVTVATSTSDPDGDTVVVTFSKPAHGTISGTGPNYIYTADPGFSGTDTFTGTAHDGRGGTSMKTTVVTVAPIDALVGNYSVLLSDANGDVAAHLLMTTTRAGRATGVVTVGGIRYSVRGLFTGATTMMLPRLDHYGSVQLDLSIDLANPGGPALVVMVTNRQGTYTGRTVRSPYSPQHRAPQAGKYTIIVSREGRIEQRAGVTLAAADPGTPTVASVIAVQVRASGAVIFNGVTGNNYRITCSSYIMPGNLVPFYASRLAPGASVQTSMLTFPTDPALGTVDPNAPAISGLARWNAVAGPRLRTGVDADYAVLGAHYRPPTSGAGLLNAPRLTLHLAVPSFTGEGLNPSYLETRTFVANLLPQIAGYVSPVRVTLGNGMYIGRVQGRVPRPFFGIILQGEGIDAGLGSLLDYTSLSTCELNP